MKILIALELLIIVIYILISARIFQSKYRLKYFRKRFGGCGGLN